MALSVTQPLHTLIDRYPMETADRAELLEELDRYIEQTRLFSYHNGYKQGRVDVILGRLHRGVTTNESNCHPV